jgi:charged multivesicular body protein 4
VATAALKRKKAFELEMDRLSGTRLQLEMQVNTLESANLNAETMAAMKKGSDALKSIHGGLCVYLPYHQFAAIGVATDKVLGSTGR